MRGPLVQSLTLYLDESGDRGRRPPQDNSTTKDLVIGGTALDPGADNRAQQLVEDLVRRYLGSPPAGRSYELRFSSLLSRRGVYRQLTRQQAESMTDEVIGLLLDLKPILFASVVDKERHQARYGVNAVDPKRLALRGIVHRFNLTLERIDAYGAVVMDEEEYRKDADLRAMIHRARTLGLSMRGMLYDPQYASKPSRINGPITFSPSEMSSGIQLADVCASIVWKKYEKRRDDLFNQVEPLFDRTGSRRWEPSIVPR